MAVGRLSPLQVRVLEALAGVSPPWTLTGGGALAGFHTAHRTTRDLDLFFRGENTLGDVPLEVRDRLADRGISATVVRTTPRLSQLDVSDGADSVIVDLVADPTPIAEPPEPMALGTVTVLVDTMHQLLVNKLCALLSRSELRDLVDVRVLLERGGDLARALEDCPRQDAGFSPLTFGWSVRGLPVERLAVALGHSPEEAATLAAFRDGLVARVIDAARPDA